MASNSHTSTKQDLLQHLLMQGQATAQDLASALDVSPQAIRRHLKDLEDEQLIVHEVVQAGMGRPNHLYKLSRTGRDRFPHRYDEFAVGLLDTLTETFSQDQMQAILKKQWQRKADHYRQQMGDQSLPERLAALVAMRQAEGYMAEWCTVEQDVAATPDTKRFLFLEHHCAIANIAESFPSVCGNELAMFAAALPDCQVERTEWIVDGQHRCGYLIQQY